MNHVRKVIFTGDILRPVLNEDGGWESATRKNIRWLAHLVGWQLAHATGLPLGQVAWEPDGFDGDRFYAAMDLEPGPDAWASVYHASRLPAEAESLLVTPFLGALVVGFEMPEVLHAALTRAGIPIVDIVVHPVRFMDDLMFAFRTNDAAIHARLLQHEFDTETCSGFAHLHQAKAQWMPALDLPERTALITGQVATHPALIDRGSGRFLSLANFVERLFDVCGRHPHVIFKPHPQQSSDCPSREVIEAFPSIRIVTDNFYYLLGQDAITDVYSISSGTIAEALYFGKHGHAFGELPYKFGERPPAAGRCGACIPIGSVLLEPSFWSDVLGPIVTTRMTVPAGPPHRESRLRRSLDADWDYGYIDAVVHPPRAKEVPPAALVNRLRVVSRL